MKIRSEVLAIIASGQFDGPNFRITAQLERRTYQDVAKVVEAVGGKWNRRAQALVFDGDAAEALEPVILTGEVTSRKQDLGQFDTPPDVAELVSRKVDWERFDAAGKNHRLALEPSAGAGNLVQAMVDRGCPLDAIVAYEVDPKRCDALARRFSGIVGITNRDFLRTHPEPAPIFGLCLMNPPFAKRADIYHVSHAARFVKPGGQLVAIMSAGITFRQDGLTMEFRHVLTRRGGEIEMLPPGAFKASGTDVNACVVSFYV